MYSHAADLPPGIIPPGGAPPNPVHPALPVTKLFTPASPQIFA